MKKKGKNALCQHHFPPSISATGATKNLRRFGQSIKRVVREVKEDSGSNAIFLYYLCPYIPPICRKCGSDITYRGVHKRSEAYTVIGTSFLTKPILC